MITETKGRAVKRVPTYWWDWVHHEDGSMSLVVESDDGRFPVVGRPREIQDAERLIADLNAGRADPRALAKAL